MRNGATDWQLWLVVIGLIFIELQNGSDLSYMGNSILQQAPPPTQIYGAVGGLLVVAGILLKMGFILNDYLERKRSVGSGR